MKTPGVILVDSHTLVRAGVRLLLESSGLVDVLGETGDPDEALEMLAEQHPDLALVELQFPQANGLSMIDRMIKEHPEVLVIVLTIDSSSELVLDAIRLGVSGYLLKESSPEELLLAIRTVVGGEKYLSASISKHIIENHREKSASDQLTPRQRQILRLISEGKSTREIASILKVSTKTVESHRAHLMRRLQIFDVPGLVRYAVRKGIV